MHICTVIVHLQNNFVYLYIFTSTDVGIFGLKCTKLSTFCILQIFTATLLKIDQFTVTCFIGQPFKDMIEGMKLDLTKSRYENFDELYLYCYHVAGTVGLMSVPVIGIAPKSKASIESVYNAALALGIANQLTNILRDVGEE